MAEFNYLDFLLGAVLPWLISQGKSFRRPEAKTTPEVFSVEKKQKYENRLILECDVISKMGFSSYFLIVADFVNWAKNNGVPVGPGRGSGAGSLVAYCLNITDVDPIKFLSYLKDSLIQNGFRCLISI